MPVFLLVFAVLVGLSLISWVGIYNFPAADDFAMVMAAQEKGFWQAQIHWYTQWGGKYTGVFLASLVPLENIWLYRAIPILLLAGITAALFLTLRRMFDGLSVNRREACSIACLLILCFLAAMPSLNQGFFWVSGAVTYMTSGILLLVLAWLLLSPRNFLRSGLMVVLCLMIPGLNETALVLLIYLLTAFLVFTYVREKRVDKFLVLLLGLSMACGLAVFFAPGNSIRFPHFPFDHNLPRALGKALAGSALVIGKWLAFPPLILLSLATVGFLGSALKDRVPPFPLNSWKLWLLNLLLVVYLGLFPGAWVFGGIPPLRAMNLIYLAFLLSLGLLLIPLSQLKALRTLTEVRNWMAAFFVLGLALNKSNFSVVSANLFKGTAKNYALELERRAELIQSCSQDPCEVPPLVHHPAAIYFDDITADLNDWRNQSYSKFHGKNIKLSEAVGP